MTRLLGSLALILGGMLVVGAAGADDAPTSKLKGDFEAFFKKLDANLDGKLSKNEFLQMADRAKEKDKARAKLAKVYDMLDADKKGLSRDQFKTYLESKKKS